MSGLAGCHKAKPKNSDKSTKPVETVTINAAGKYLVGKDIKPGTYYAVLTHLYTRRDKYEEN